MSPLSLFFRLAIRQLSPVSAAVLGCPLLMQCLTMDCCGAGRLFEALFDMVAFAWWLAVAVTLTIRCAAGCVAPPGLTLHQEKMCRMILGWLAGYVLRWGWHRPLPDTVAAVVVALRCNPHSPPGFADSLDCALLCCTAGELMPLLLESPRRLLVLLCLPSAGCLAGCSW